MVYFLNNHNNKRRRMLNQYLQDHLEEHFGDTWIHSPFTAEIYHGSRYDDTLNVEYEAWVVARKKAIDEGRFEDYVWLAARPYRLNAFEELVICKAIGYERAAKLIMAIWRDVELPGFHEDYWRVLFADFRDSQAFADTKRDLPKRFKVWRGGDADGLSWTMDEAVARTFSTMHRRNGEIHSKVIGRKQVLFYTDNRNEKEVVLGIVDK
jgi:hypothetical protein